MSSTLFIVHFAFPSFRKIVMLKHNWHCDYRCRYVRQKKGQALRDKKRS